MTLMVVLVLVLEHRAGESEGGGFGSAPGLSEASSAEWSKSLDQSNILNN